MRGNRIFLLVGALGGLLAGALWLFESDTPQTLTNPSTGPSRQTASVAPPPQTEGLPPSEIKLQGTIAELEAKLKAKTARPKEEMRGLSLVNELRRRQQQRLEREVERFPNQVDAINRLAFFVWENGDLQRAEELFQRSARLRPSVAILESLQEVRKTLAMTDYDARQMARRAVFLMGSKVDSGEVFFPGDDNPLPTELGVGLAADQAERERRDGRTDDALEDLRLALPYAPQEKRLLFPLVLTHLQRGEKAEAQAAFEVLKQHHPLSDETLMIVEGWKDSVQPQQVAAWLSTRWEHKKQEQLFAATKDLPTGSPEEFEKIFEPIVVLDPSTNALAPEVREAKRKEKQQIQRHLYDADRYLETGDLGRATEALNSVIVLDPSNSVALDALKLLQQRGE